MTAEDLLALPLTPPESQIPNCQSAVISSSFCFAANQPTPPLRSQSHFSTEIANLLAYVRGRPISERNASDHDLTDFEEWLNDEDNGEVSGDEEKVEESFNWPTDDRLIMDRKNDRNGPQQFGSNGKKPFDRESENRRIDELLNGSVAGNSNFNFKY